MHKSCRVVLADLSFLRDLHNDFHSGLGCTFMEMILGVPEVDQASAPQSVCNLPYVLQKKFVAYVQAWFKHAEKNGLTSTTCQWGKLQGEFVKANFGARYKTGQAFDLSKRVYNALHRDLCCLTEFSDFFGEFSDFTHSEMNALTCLQNLHSWAKIVTQSLMSSYPQPLMVSLFLEGCKFLVARSTQLAHALLDVPCCACCV